MRHWRFAVLPSVVVASLALPAAAQQLTALSVAPSGAFGDFDSSGPSVSADGRFVAFVSAARNLIGPELDLDADVFVADTWDRTLARASSSPSGAEGNGESYRPALSSSGRFIGFASTASNLTAAAVPGTPQVYVRALDTGATTLVSVNLSGAGSAGRSEWIDVSDDGRFAAFVSRGGDLINGDTNFQEDVFLRDLVLGVTTRISLTTAGQEASWPSGPFSAATCVDVDLTPDGRFAAFSTIFALSPADTNAQTDVYVFDRLGGALELVSRSSSGALGDGASFLPQLSADGRWVLFSSHATNLVSGDTNLSPDVFLRDRVLGVLTCVSRSGAGVPVGASNVSDAPARLTSDASVCLFSSPSSVLAAGDTNGVDDLFLYTRATGAVEIVRPLGIQPNAPMAQGVLSEQGLLAFRTSASNLLPGDTNGRTDVFAWAPASCAPVAYCTSGTSALGCSAQLSASGAASLSNCTLAFLASQVDAQRQGLLFYGTSGAVAFPWGASSSYFCVKSPTQRTPVQSSGGSVGACNGALALDWCAFLAANPNALGAPFAAGDAVFMQAWFRDPAGPKSTALSNGVRTVFCP